MRFDLVRQIIRDDGALPCHSQPPERRDARLLPKAHLSPPASHRELLLPYQRLAPHRHPLRQARLQLPRRHLPGRRSLLDQAVSPDPRVVLIWGWRLLPLPRGFAHIR